MWICGKGGIRTHFVGRRCRAGDTVLGGGRSRLLFRLVLALGQILSLRGGLRRYRLILIQGIACFGCRLRS